MGKRVTIREAATILGVSSDTIRRRLRSSTLTGERVETPQGYVWYIDIPEDAGAPPVQTPGQSPMQPPMQDGASGMLAILREQLIVKDEQIARQARMMEAMREEHAREVEQLHILLQTSQQNEQRLLSATVPDIGTEMPGDALRAGTNETHTGQPPSGRVSPESSQRDPPPRRPRWFARLFGAE